MKISRIVLLKSSTSVRIASTNHFMMFDVFALSNSTVHTDKLKDSKSNDLNINIRYINLSLTILILVRQLAFSKCLNFTWWYLT